MENHNHNKEEIQPLEEETQIIIPNGKREKGYITLPFGEDEFKNFIKSLLGSPQSIEKVINGSFEIEMSDIENLYQLITQRVGQQNGGALINFNAKIIYSDNSSVEIDRIEELITYNEVKPVICRSIHLKWDFVVQFTDKEFREKQQISVSFVTKSRSTIIMRSNISPSSLNTEALMSNKRLEMRSNHVLFRIEHTARSWGADMESLLSNHISTLIKNQKGARGFVRRNSGTIGLYLGIFSFLASVIASIYSVKTHSNSQIGIVSNEMNSFSGPDAINKKLDFLSTLIAGGSWPQYYLWILAFLLLCTGCSIMIGIWSGSAFDVEEPSFILITKESRNEKVRVLEGIESSWKSFIYSVIFSLFWGIVGNMIFAMFFANLPMFKPK